MRLGTLIRDAVEDSCTGPGLGPDVSRDVLVDDEHRYTVSTEDTDERCCMRITMPRVDLAGRFPFFRPDHHLTATAGEGAC
jgi:hypothetical protein